MSASWQKMDSGFGEIDQTAYSGSVSARPAPKGTIWTSGPNGLKTLSGSVRPSPIQARLAETVDRAVIPRMVLARRAAPERLPTSWAPLPANVVQLADCAVSGSAEAEAYVAALQGRGADTEAVYLDLLAPAARRLGELWETDALSFADVTIGVMRLHRIMGTLGSDFRGENMRERPGRRALLVPAPGEQHSFGLAMVSAFFRRAGWSVWSGPALTLPNLLRLVRAEWFGVVGFSAGTGERLELLSSCIRQVRQASRNASLGIMVGGPVFSEQGLAGLVGADATAQDGRHATFQAEGLLAMQPDPV